MNDAHETLHHRHSQHYGYQFSFKRRAVGFTLLELVVAAALLAVLVTAVVSVLRVLLAETRNTDAAGAAVLPESLARLMRRDVINARSYRLANSQLDLLGYVAQDDDSGRPLLTLAIASYQIRTTQRGGLLLRVQQSLDGGSGMMPMSNSAAVQPLWLGVGAINLTSSYLDTRDVSLLPPAVMQSLSAEPAPDGRSWLPLSTTVELTLLGGQGQTLFRESIARDSRSAVGGG